MPAAECMESANHHEELMEILLALAVLGDKDEVGSSDVLVGKMSTKEDTSTHFIALPHQLAMRKTYTSAVISYRKKDKKKRNPHRFSVLSTTCGRKMR